MDIPERARLFIQYNPEVYGLFDRIAREAIARGRRRYSADAIFHIIRWTLHIEMNDDFTAEFAREWLSRNPDYPTFFETRRSQCDRPPDRQYPLPFGEQPCPA